MIGQSISHYEILEKLGEGGMGAVYKARDTVLDRFVALKVLLPGKVIGEDRRARFVQEARAASALNHPNIITIHEIGSSSGVDFIVMEFIRGRTLDHVTGRKGLSVAETLKYAVQIADALAAAHAAGIVHRDLKPGNLMVSDKGLVKVLDFGLAKLTEPAHTDESSATETVKLAEAPRTEEGMILGTVSYMSPEQAEGKKVDARSDIFSFGAVLYEMTTGRRAFQGDTKLATLSAILREEPPPAGTLSPGVPRELERTIARCLRKDPGRRFQLMEDVKIALEELKEESDSGTLAREIPDARAPRRAMPRWMAPAAAVLIALGAAAWWWFGREHRPAQHAAARLVKLTSDAGLTTDPVLSPDGKLVAYASDRSGQGNLDIWVQQVATGESVQLTRHEADEYSPDFAPDGSTIAFRSDRDGGGIYTVAALGGEPRPIVKNGRGPKYSPDGAWIAYWAGEEQNTPTQIFVMPAAGGAPRRLRPDFAAARSPVWTPDGKHLLFVGGHDTARRYEWWVTPIEGGDAMDTGVIAACARIGARTGLSASGFILPGSWTPDGRVIFAARYGDSTNLWRVALAPRTWKIAADPERITYGAGEEIKPAAAGGRIVFSSRSMSTDVWSVRVDPASGKLRGQPERITSDGAIKMRPSLSADAGKLSFLSMKSGSPAVWVKDLASGTEKVVRPAAPGVRIYSPMISRDGSQVAYELQEPGKDEIYTVSSGGGVPEKICDDCGRPQIWSHDGRKLWYDSGRRTIGRSLLLLDIASGKSHEYVRAGMQIYNPTFSPDDKWFSFHAQTSVLGRTIYAVPLRGDAPVPQDQWVAVTDGGSMDREPYWSEAGLIYFLSERDGFRCIWAVRPDAQTRRATAPPFPVLHMHNSRISLSHIVNTAEIGLSEVKGRLTYMPGEISSNVWMTEQVEPGR